MSESGTSSRQRRIRRGQRVLKAGLLAGLVAAVLNVIIYLIMLGVGGYAWEAMIVISILVASLLPNILAAIVYFGVMRLTKKYARTILTVGVTGFVLASVLPHLGVGPAPSPALAALPEGFDLVTVPLHIVFGLTAILLMPWLADKT